ncbi:MAG: YggT family protein [Bacilli bacterium]|nr:YggT family protein [Bacilli bacterium]
MTLNNLFIVLYVILWIYHLFVFVGIILTWIPSALNTKVGAFIYESSNWLLAPFRGWLVLGAIDFTPVLGVLLLQFVMRIFEEIIF